MHFVVAIVFIAAGLLLLTLALRHRSTALASAATLPAPTAFAEIARGVVLAGVGLGGANVVLFYLALGGGPLVSGFTMAGFLFLLAAFAAWFAVRMTYPLYGVGDPP